jgi:hypothetical protein
MLYVLRVRPRYSGAGPFALNLSVAALPGNDAFANATPLSGTDVARSGSTRGATAETGEDSSLRSVWYSWRAPLSGRARATALPNHRVTVYGGTSLDRLGRVLEMPGLDAETVEWRTTNEVLYFLRVQPFDGSYYD